MLCGGRHQMYTNILDDLFSRLDADLVFFQDGYIMDTKFNTWAKRQNKNYNNSIKVIDQINQLIPLKRIVEKFYNLIYSKTMITSIEESCKKHGQLIFAVYRECDQELAKFASKNSRVLAVFSNDSDFLIFAGAWRYFSIKDINLKTLKTKEFNRKAFKSQLKLNYYQLSILATIAGNDIVLREELKRFHSSFDHKGTTFDRFASYIKKNFQNPSDHQNSIHFLAQEIYGSNHIEHVTRVHQSITSYNVFFENPENPFEVYLRDHHLFTFNILNGSPLNLSLVYFDSRPNDMSYFELSVPILQRQAGIVLMQSSKPDSSLTIYSKVSHLSNYSRLFASPIFPPFEVPSLDELYSDDPTYDENRFDLLKWTINWEKLKDFDLRLIPSTYMIAVLTIVYLKQLEIISSKEADIFLWTIKNVVNNTIPRNLRPPTVLNPRAFRLSFLYTKMFANVARSIEVCGFKKQYWVSWSKKDQHYIGGTYNFLLFCRNLATLMASSFITNTTNLNSKISTHSRCLINFDEHFE